MDVSDAIDERRAYRSLAPVGIADETLEELARAAQLAPSCFNNQPARFVFVRDREMLGRMHEVLSSGNEWARAASMVIAVFCEKESDCVIRDREYYLFDTGLAVGQLLLRATELGLVAHPIAGYSPKKTREVLGIPEQAQVIALIMVGKHAEDISSVLSEKQAESEHERPERLPIEQVAFRDRYPASAGQ
jgi:nitroreductase